LLSYDLLLFVVDNFLIDDGVNLYYINNYYFWRKIFFW